VVRLEWSEDFSLAFDESTVTTSGGKTPVTLNINRTGGFSGNVTVSPPLSTPRGIVLPLDSITTKGNSVTFKITVKVSAQRGIDPLLFAGKDDSNREWDATIALLVQ